MEKFTRRDSTNMSGYRRAGLLRDAEFHCSEDAVGCTFLAVSLETGHGSWKKSLLYFLTVLSLKPTNDAASLAAFITSYITHYFNFYEGGGGS